MKITNISKNDVHIYLKDIDGTEFSLVMKPGCIVFSPTEEKTKSINLHGMKKNIGISFEVKPGFLDFFKLYTEYDLNLIDVETSKMEVPILDVVNEVVTKIVVSETEVKNIEITKRENEPQESMDGDIKFLIDKKFKSDFKDYCSKKGFTTSERIRFLMEDDYNKNNI